MNHNEVVNDATAFFSLSCDRNAAASECKFFINPINTRINPGRGQNHLIFPTKAITFRGFIIFGANISRNGADNNNIYIFACLNEKR
ncbi:MAG: hypothetical protein M0P38_03525 [Bacteroidales bacterium]|nr:hypothetical protein [Bacteroidales bacterium]